MMCISLFSYGRPVVVRCMGVRLGMGWVGSVIWWVGSMKIDPLTTLVSVNENPADVAWTATSTEASRCRRSDEYWIVACHSHKIASAGQRWPPGWDCVDESISF